MIDQFLLEEEFVLFAKKSHTYHDLQILFWAFAETPDAEQSQSLILVDSLMDQARIKKTILKLLIL